jgi:hypothetical protein
MSQPNRIHLFSFVWELMEIGINFSGSKLIYFGKAVALRKFLCNKVNSLPKMLPNNHLHPTCYCCDLQPHLAGEGISNCVRLCPPAGRVERGRWAGKTGSRSERGRSEVVVLVRDEVWVTAVLSAKCGQGNGRPWSRPTTGAADATAAAFLA